MSQTEQPMTKQVGDYILDCLRALSKDEMEVELANRIRQIRQYWEQLWGGAVPQDERVFAAFISNDPGSREPKDLWYFTNSHCLVAKEVTSAKLDLLVYPFKNGIKRMRVAKNYGDQPAPGARFVVGLWFDDDSKVVLEAADGNCLPLETLLEEVLVPRLQ
jgi:hypothetical protein